MTESCACCQAAAVKANGVDATLVLLFTLVGDSIKVPNVIEALCKKHGARLDTMVYRYVAGTAVQPKKRASKARAK